MCLIESIHETGSELGYAPGAELRRYLSPIPEIAASASCCPGDAVAAASIVADRTAGIGLFPFSSLLVS